MCSGLILLVIYCGLKELKVVPEWITQSYSFQGKPLEELPVSGVFILSYLLGITKTRKLK